MMEKRTLIAMVLAMALLGLNIWVQERFFPSAPGPKTAPPTSETAAPPLPAAAPVAPQPPAAAATPVTPRPAPGPRPPQTLINMETPLYRAVVSSEGGKLQDLTLKYRGEKPMVVVGELGPLGLVVGEVGARGEPVPMTARAETVRGSAAKPERLLLSGEWGGLRVQETLEFQPDGYGIAAAVRVENPGPGPRAVLVELPWSTRENWGSVAEKFPGQHPVEILWSSGGTVTRLEDLTKVSGHTVDGDWIALGSTWYLSALVPKTPGFKLIVSSEERAPQVKNGGAAPAGRAGIAVRATPTVAGGSAWEGRVLLYVGPKEYERLRAHGLGATINFGGFPIPRGWGGLPMEWLGIPILLLMNWVYAYVGNYGIAIILLTIVTKVLFYPLTVKSLRSMKAMQALQPRINALRAKHQKDPQRLQRETMALYKEYKVNPAGGCLPMVAQVPIFYALYLALSLSVELQNASFLCFGRLFGKDLWICDLAAQDPTYVLPLLMGVTMFVQQKMQPTVGDPRQAKMMLLMPVVFTFMFLNLPSGLVLYWTVSNVLQIAQQKLMERPAQAHAAREAKDAGPA